MKILFLICLLFSVNALAQLKSTSRQAFSTVNLLNDNNPGFENGLARWIKSGSSTVALDSSNYYDGKRALTWDASASGEYLRSSLIAIPDGLKGRNCLVSMQYKWTSGSNGDIKLQAYDGTNILVEVELSKTTNWQEAFAAFTCPTSGSIALRLYSTANATAITLDQTWLGGNNKLVDISQASLYGSLVWAGSSSCIWNRTNSAYGDYTVQSNCTTPTVRNKALEPATKLPAVKFDSLEPGIYKVLVNGIFATSSSSPSCHMILTDGTNVSGYARGQSGEYNNTLIGIFEYTSAQGATTFTIQNKGDGTNPCEIYARYAADEKLTFQVYHYPLASQKAVSLDTQGFVINADISGSSITLTNGTTTYSELTNSSETLHVNSKSHDVEIACASGTASSGNTCSSNESLGIAFDIPKAGFYNVCSTFTEKFTNSTGSTYMLPTYKLAETNNNNSTILQSGQGETGGGGYLYAVSGQRTIFTTKNICEPFYFSSTGKKTIRLMYVLFSNGVITIELATVNNYGIPNMHWTVYPITQNFPQAVAINNVSSNCSTANGNICSGTYTPSANNTTNVTTALEKQHIYYRIGNVVTVFGRTDITATTTSNTLTRFYINLPISTNLATEFDLIGTGENEPSSDNTRESNIRIRGDSSSNQADILYYSRNGGVREIRYHFSYIVK